MEGVMPPSRRLVPPRKGVETPRAGGANGAKVEAGFSWVLRVCGSKSLKAKKEELRYCYRSSRLNWIGGITSKRWRNSRSGSYRWCTRYW